MAEPALDDLDLVIKTMATTIVDNAEYFAQLDSIVGDGDFGFSLRNGFEVVASDYDSWDQPNVGAVLRRSALPSPARLAASAGPIWGTAFLRAGISAGDKAELHAGRRHRAGPCGDWRIKQRGESDLGDKTLLDALVPAVDSLEASFADPAPARDHGVAALQQAADVAVQGRRGHETDDRQAGPRGLHGRAKHRLG